MKILIVEDSSLEMELLKYILQENFMIEAKFREANTIEVALTYLARNDIDCVILDLNLPDSSGIDSFDAIHSIYPHIPIIVMTGNQDRELIMKMIKAGAADYIVKDFTKPKEMFERIINAYKKKKYKITTDIETTGTINRVTSNRAQITEAYKTGTHITPKMNHDAMTALADMTSNLFLKTQEQSILQAKTSITVDMLVKQVDELKSIINGKEKSILTRLSVIEHKVKEIEKGRKKLESIADEEIKEIKNKAKPGYSNTTTIILAIITLIGSIVGGYFTYKAAVANIERGNATSISDHK